MEPMPTEDNEAESGLDCDERERANEPCHSITFTPAAVFAGVGGNAVARAGGGG